MFRKLLNVFLAVSLLGIFSVASFAANDGGKAKKERNPGTVLYKMKAEATPDQQKSLSSVLSSYDLRLDRKLVNGSVIRVKSHGQAIFAEEGMAADIKLTGAVEWAEPDYVEEAVATPNDPYYANEWQHVNIRSAGAWDITTGNSQIIVAVCDTGVDLTHPDLASHLVLPGWNTYLNNTNCADTQGHGTMVAGFAAATGNNGIGVAGTAWNVRILPIRMTYADGVGSAYVSDMAEAITYGADQGAKVINISFSGYYNSAIITAADYARGKGSLVVMAAANDGADISTYADPPSIVLVGATTTTDVRASFSNYGTPIDVVAPGVNVWSTTNGGGYGYGSGTSFSSPITAGLAALIYSINPDFTPAEVEGFIESTCKDIGATGEDAVYGFGLIQADAAVAKAQNSIGNQPPLAVASVDRTSGDIPLTVNFDGSASSDPDGSIASYSWDFGDGSGVAYGYFANHTYTIAGTFVVTLTVTDNLGSTDTANLTITAADPNKVNAPSGLTATAASKTVTLKWADNSGNETGFYIERGVKSKTSITYTRVGTVAANVKTFSETRTSGTYYYRVQAYKTGTGGTVTSTYSNAVTIKVR